MHFNSKFIVDFKDKMKDALIINVKYFFFETKCKIFLKLDFLFDIKNEHFSLLFDTEI